MTSSKSVIKGIYTEVPYNGAKKYLEGFSLLNINEAGSLESFFSGSSPGFFNDWNGWSY
jgi:hypothetical protein